MSDEQLWPPATEDSPAGTYAAGMPAAGSGGDDGPGVDRDGRRRDREAPKAQATAGTSAAPVVTRTTEPAAGAAVLPTPPGASAARRRVYRSASYLQSAYSPMVQPGAEHLPAQAAPAPFWTGAAARPAGDSAGERLSLAWPLQVVLTLPLVSGAAVSTGAAVYLVAVAVAAGDIEAPRILLAVGAAIAVAIAALSILGWIVVLRPARRTRLGLSTLIAGACGGLIAAALAVLNILVLPSLAAAGLLGWVTLVSGLRWFAFGEEPAGHAGPFGGLALAAGTVGTLIATALAVAAGFAAFSLAAASFVAGQEAFGWHQTLLSEALDRPPGGAALHVATLVFANLGIASVFGLLVYAAARCLGRWRSPLVPRWAIVLGGLVVAGAVAWVFDPSLPGLW